MSQIATVKSITGTAFVVGLDGQTRPLKAGDTIQKGETIVTSADGRVELAMEGGGQPLAVGPAQTVKVEDSVAEATRPEPQQASTASGTVDSVIQALEQGGDLNQQLEATAAGAGGGGGEGGGSSFVRLLRVSEGVDPLAYQFATERPDLNQVPLGEGETIALLGDFASGVFESSLDFREGQSPGTNEPGVADRTGGTIPYVPGSRGADQLYVIDRDGNEINVSNGGTVQGQYGTLTITKGVDGSYSWVYQLDGNIAHPNAENAAAPGYDGSFEDDTLPETFTVQVREGTQVVAEAKLNITIHDDGPQVVAGPVENREGGDLIVMTDDTDLRNNDSTSDGDYFGEGAAFQIVWGADGPMMRPIENEGGQYEKGYYHDPSATSFALTVVDGTDSGLVDNATNQSIYLYKVGDEVWGRVGKPEGEGSEGEQGGEGWPVAFKLSVNEYGYVNLTQLRAIEHDAPNGEGDGDTVKYLAQGAVQVALSATDSDGDVDTASFDLGGRVGFGDDEPTVRWPVLIEFVEEESVPKLGGNNEWYDFLSYKASGSILGAVNWGADGFGSVTKVTVGGTEVTVGQTVYFDANGARMVTEDDDGDDVPSGAKASLVVREDGTYSIQVLGAMNHPAGWLENFLMLPKVQITAIDGDGDAVTLMLIGKVQDDVPIAKDDPLVMVKEDIQGTVGGNVLANDKPGADGAEMTHVRLPGGQWVAITQGTANQDGSYGFTTSLGVYTFKSTGEWTFDPTPGQNNAHGISAGFSYRITDGDGDTDTAVQPIKLLDGQGPQADEPITLALDDQNLSNGTTPAGADHAEGSITFAAGSDPIASIVFDTNLSNLSNTLTWTRVSNTQIVGKDGTNTVVTLDLTVAGNVATVKATLNDNYAQHPDITADDLAALGSVRVVATDIDGDKAYGQVNVTVSDDVPTVEVLSEVKYQLTLTNYPDNVEAGFENSFGYYVKDVNGNPTSGVLLWGNVKDSIGISNFTVSGYTPDKIGFFLIPNGGTANALPPIGAEGLKVVFVQQGGGWYAALADEDGNPTTVLKGSAGTANESISHPALFDNPDLNVDGRVHVMDKPNVEGNLNWEDLYLGSDQDYDDANINYTWTAINLPTIETQDKDTKGDAFDHAQVALDGAGGLFKINAFMGADDGGASGLVKTYTLSIGSGKEQTTLKSSGAGITLSVDEDGSIVGRTGAGAEGLIFRISVVQDDGQYVLRLTQYQELDHPIDQDLLGLVYGSVRVTLDVTITDADGDTARDSQTMDVSGAFFFRDDVPMANPDIYHLVEDGDVSSVGGNVLANDDPGADGPAHFGGWGSASEAMAALNTYGTLTLSAGGNWSYVLDNSRPATQALGADFEQTFKVPYTMRDDDGDPSSSYLSITIKGAADATPVLVVGQNISDTTQTQGTSSTTDDHRVDDSPFKPDGPIQGNDGDDILVGDTGGSTIKAGDVVNIVVVIDRSGSMDSTISFNGKNITRLEATKLAVQQMLDNLYNSGAQAVKVHVVQFATTAQDVGTFTLTANGTDSASQLKDAKAAISGITVASGSNSQYTNYEAGLQKANAWINSSGPLASGNVNKVVFVSDGEPNRALDNNGNVVTVNSSQAIQHILGSGQNDSTNEVYQIETSGTNGGDQAFTIEAVGINLSATALGVLTQVEGPGGSATNASTTGQLVSVIGDVSGSQTNVQAVGNDQIIGGDGNDLIFGDVINTDALARANNINLPAGSGWQVFEQLGWSQQQVVDYIRANHAELSVEDGNRSGGNDNIQGGGGHDIIYGQVGNDVIDGGAGNDTIHGGSGNDTLTGGEGADVFAWRLGDQGTGATPAVDHITDFSQAQGDKLDLRDLLQGENSGNLGQYLSFSEEGGKAVLNVKTNAGGAVETKIVFDNMSLSQLQTAFDADSTNLLQKMKNAGAIDTN